MKRAATARKAAEAKLVPPAVAGARVANHTGIRPGNRTATNRDATSVGRGVGGTKAGRAEAAGCSRVLAEAKAAAAASVSVR